MTDTAPARPPNLTLALLFIAFTSGLLLINVVGALMSWTSLDLQEGLRDALDDPQLRQAGLSVDGVVTGLRIASYVLVPVAVAGIVLAVFALRGHRGSRIPLTVLAGLGALLFLLAVLSGGFVAILPGALLLISAVTIWSPDARRWFAVKNGRPDPTRPDAGAAAATSPPSPVAGPDREEPTTLWPTSDQGDVERPDDPPTSTAATSGWPAYPGLSTGPSGPVPPTGPETSSIRPGRPGVVWGASITAGVSSLLVLGFGLLLVLGGTALREPYRQAVQEDPQLRRQLAESSYTLDQLLDVVAVAGAVIAVLALLGLVASIAYVLHWPGGLVALCLMSAVAVASAITCVGLVVAVPAVVTIVLALRPDARAWSSRR